MTDPLSLTASLVGLISTALHVTHKLVTFTKNANGAPKQAQTVLAEVRDLHVIIGQCKELILTETASDDSNSQRIGPSIVLVDHVVVVLSGCVITFSELEELLGMLNIEGEMDMLDCAKWARKEAKIATIVGRLQNHKASLTAMLAVLGCSNQIEAKQSLNRLNTLVEQLVLAHQDLFGRISEIELRQGVERQSSPSPDLIGAVSTTPTTNWPLAESSAEDQSEETLFDLQLETAIQETLASSRVYRRAYQEVDQISLISGATRATPWSLLSGISLADISAVSIVALPIFSSTITNSQHYSFTKSKCCLGDTTDENDSDTDVPTRRINLFRLCGLEKPSRHWPVEQFHAKGDIWSLGFCLVFDDILSSLDPERYSICSPELERWIGLVPQPSPRRALQRLFNLKTRILQTMQIIDHLVRTSQRRKRLAWRLRHRKGTEAVILADMLKAQQLAFALDLYLEWLESHSETVAEKDADFHIKLADPNEAYTPFPEKRRCVLVFGDEASHLLARLHLDSSQSEPPLSEWLMKEWLSEGMARWFSASLENETFNTSLH